MGRRGNKSDLCSHICDCSFLSLFFLVSALSCSCRKQYFKCYSSVIGAWIFPRPWWAWTIILESVVGGGGGGSEQWFEEKEGKKRGKHSQSTFSLPVLITATVLSHPHNSYIFVSLQWRHWASVNIHNVLTQPLRTGIPVWSLWFHLSMEQDSWWSKQMIAG